MAKLEIIKCSNPYELKVDGLIVSKVFSCFDTEFAEDRVVRNIKVLNYCEEDPAVLAKLGCAPEISHLIQITQQIDYNSYFALRDIDYYRETINECTSLLRDFCGEGNKFALPIVTFEGIAGDSYDYKNEEPLYDLACIVIEWFCSKHPPEKIYLYITDDFNIEIDEIREKFNTIIKNILFAEYKNESDVKQIVESNKEDVKVEEPNRFNDRHLPIDEYVAKYFGQGFADFINQFLNSKKIKSSVLYTEAQISKQDFSKMMTYPQLPVKQEKQKYDTIALLFPMHLSIKDFKKVLASRNFALSDYSKKDLIIEYFILNEVYNLVELNSELEKRNHSVIGNSIK